MVKKKVASSVDELDQRTAEAIADIGATWRQPLEAALRVPLSDDDVGYIAQAADQCVLTGQLSENQHDWTSACMRVARTAAALGAAIRESAKYRRNLDNLWTRSGADEAVKRIEQEARALAEGRKRNKRDIPLRSLVAAVLHGYHNAGRRGIGINTDRLSGARYGPVLHAVKRALRIAGVRKLPSDSTIRNVAWEIVKGK